MGRDVAASLRLIFFLLALCQEVESYALGSTRDSASDVQPAKVQHQSRDVTTSGSVLQATVPPSNGSNTSPGVAAGIAVAVIGGAGLLSAVIVFIVLRRKKQRQAYRIPDDPASPSPDPGIRALDEVGSINPLAKKTTRDGPFATKAQYANQIYQGPQSSSTVSSPRTTVSVQIGRKSYEKTLR